MRHVSKLLNRWISEYEEYGESAFPDHGTALYLCQYKIKKLKPLYEQFISIYSDKLIEIKQIYKESDFVNAGLALPILHEHSKEFIYDSK